MKRVTVILEVLILIGLVGCGKSKEKTIVGKWKEVGGTQTIEFFKDGTVTVVDKGEPPLPGDYRFLDDNRIRMNLALFGPITFEISPSLYEITLTNPFGKIERYRKLGVENKKTEEKRNIAGKYVVNKEPGVITFEQDGTIMRHLAGRWVEGGHCGIKLYEGDKEIAIGAISNDAIRCFGRSFIKQKGAEVIQSLGITASLLTQSIQVQFAQAESGGAPSFLPVKFTLWSDYVASDNVSTLRFKKDGTFLIKEVLEHKWRIEDGIVQLYNRKEKIEGRIKGNTLIFEQGEDRNIFIKQD